MTRFLTLLALVAGVLFAWNAAHGSSDRSAAHSRPVAPDYHSAVAADARTLAQMTTPFQRRILADGRVTYGEYASATRATVGCLRGSRVPFRVDPIRRAPGGQLEFAWRLPRRAENDPRTRAAAMETFQRCSIEWEADVKLIYANQRVIPPRDRPAVRAQLVRCLRAANLRVPDRPSMQRLIAVIDRDDHHGADRCARRYFDFFRMPAPVGPARDAALAR